MYNELSIKIPILMVFIEAENFNTLIKEIEEAIPNLLILGYKKSLPKVSTDVIFKKIILQ